MSRAATALCAAILLAAAAYYPLHVIQRGAELQFGIAAYDFYAYFYPNVRFALDALAHGQGLLWNPFQDCGQPFFAISQTGVLYPVNWVFAWLPREPALQLNIILNLAIGGLGAWWLGREMGVSRPAALTLALAFLYSGSALKLAEWSPIHLGAYAWMPVALAAAERLLRAPSPRRAALLALVLAVQLLPGFPQISVYTYEVIALRVGWELVTGPARRRGRLLALLGVALVLAPALAAVQLLPAVEVARESVRALPLKVHEIGLGIPLAQVRAALGQSFFLQGVLTLTVLAVAAVGVTERSTRRLAVLYLLIALLSVLLALGEATPVWRAYRSLPIGGAFRGPERFLWVTGFALAVACALGVEAASRYRGWRVRLAGAFAVAAGTALFVALPTHSLLTAEVQLLALAVAGLAVARWRPLAGVAALAVGFAVATNMVRVGGPFLNHRLGELYDDKRTALQQLRARMTPQDRMFAVGWQQGLQADFALTHKIASLYRMPSIFDYEPQASLRYAQYFTYMRTGRPMASLYDWYQPSPLLLPSLKRPLFDLTAARYLVVDERNAASVDVFGTTAPEILREGEVRVYENRQALPRAFVVPSMGRVPDNAVLPMLARGQVDPRRMALVGVTDGSAWTGEGVEAAPTGRATIVRDETQRVVVEVQADAPSFLFLADQYASGWTATVDGTPAPILRANYAFRLVAVPQGQSLVEFRYAPRAVWMGAVISLASMLLVVLCLWRGGASTAHAPAIPAVETLPR